MPKVIFQTPDGERHEVVANADTNLMEIALGEGLEGIEGECGGACSCATCHVEVSQQWWDAVGKPDDMELDMLDFCEELTERSRLGCQVQLSEELDGLEVRIVGP